MKRTGMGSIGQWGVTLGLVLSVAACGGRNTPASGDGGATDGALLPDRGPVSDGDIVDALPPDMGDTPLDLPLSDGDPLPPDAMVVDGAPTPDVVVQPDLGQIDNSTCAKAAPVPLVNGKAQVSGSTQNAPNEYGTAINCGSLSTTYNGNQRYYKFSLVKGTSYRFTFADQYSNERMYIFRACGIAAINADCGSGGVNGATTASTENELVFTPQTTGDYIVALDAVSTSNQSSGNYTLTVQAFTPPTNTTCQTAQQLSLTAGKVSVTGTTSVSQNEFGTQINCGSATQVFSAPQVYYKLPMTAGTGYRISLTSRFNGARFYVFGSSCSPNDINTDCSSSGVGGVVSQTANNNQTRTTIFTPGTSATYTIAVDSTSPTASGDFDLAIEEFATPTNDSCASAQLLTLTAGKATVKATTLGAQNEFGTQIVCDQQPGVNMAGPQVYYKVAMAAGKNYKLTLKPNYPARWYLFGQVCQAGQINTDCAASGINGDLVQTGDTATRTYTPSVSGTYTIAVDSRNTGNFGDFELSVEEFSPPQNGTCATAQTLTLQNGKASVKGTTLGTQNEFGNQIQCAQNFALAGPQVYYKVALQAANSYKISLTAQYPSRWYLFGNSCVPQQINQVCATSGIGGDLVNTGDTGTAVFKPAADGTFTIAVDARTSQWFGDFELNIETFTPPTNGTCATAKTVTVLPAGQTTTITGDTLGAQNEFGNQINCGQWGGSFDGPQLYYKVALVATRSYTFTLNATFGGSRVYIARDSCNGQAIDADCAPNSPDGAVGVPFFGQPATATFQPSANGTYLLIVDSTGGAGSFTLDIQ